MSIPIKIAGVGMTPFVKPGRHDPYEVMAAKAVRTALRDAGLRYADIGQAYASYVFGDSNCGQAALYRIGLTGLPIINVNNNGSSGSSALMLARQAVLSGVVDCALAFGFEEMRPGVTGPVWTDRTSPLVLMERQLEHLKPQVPPAPYAQRIFGSAAAAYIEKTGASPTIFAKVAVKSRKHAEHNADALYRKPITVEEVLASSMIFPPYLTRMAACPPSCGAAAVIVCSERFARQRGLRRGVNILAQAMATDRNARKKNPIDLAGADMTRNAAAQVYQKAGIGPEDVDVIELHDCFTSNEVISYEALGLCGPGQAEKLIADGDNTYGGQFVVNPSGGLMSKGHPLGATGLAQCVELVTQLRGEADKRQVEGARIALQHNLGLGGAGVVTLYGSP
ncbi:MAG: lipid-transfer protein [Motiliproteus sp.]